MPRLHVAGYFRKRRFFPSDLKRICVHSYRFRIVCAEELALNLGMTSSYLKASVFVPSTRIRLISVYKTLHAGERIWKPLFSVPENAGCVWTVAVLGEDSLRFRKYPATCGQGLNFAQKLRTRQEQLRLGFKCKCNCKFLLKNTTHHLISAFHCRSFCN